MAVNVLPDALSSKSTAPTMNKRFPPLADRSSLSFKLSNLSKQKLAREATAPDPDIRRCLGHFRMHCLSVEWTQQETATKMTSLEFEDDDESEEEETPAEDLEESDKESAPAAAPTPAEPEVKVDAQPEGPSPTKDADQSIQVHFEVVAPLSEEKDQDDSIVDKGRRCLEKAQKPFWPSRGQCMPVPIAG
ncbi:hypothetical protein BDW62DRAFT_202922 [Aspergillus aurantiobrunneus]